MRTLVDTGCTTLVNNPHKLVETWSGKNSIVALDRQDVAICWKVKVMVVIEMVADIIMGMNVFNQLRGVLLDKEKVEFGQDVQ